VICLDEMGPVAAKSYQGKALVRTAPPQAERARQEIDYGRRAKGYIFGAFCPATGEAFTHPYPGRGSAHWVDFLDHVETWIPRTIERVYAIMAWVRIAPRMCCCSCSRIRAGRWCSSPNTRLTST
jgi:hypothetical protein